MRLSGELVGGGDVDREDEVRPTALNVHLRRADVSVRGSVRHDVSDFLQKEKKKQIRKEREKKVK